MDVQRYTRTAMALHWLMAAGILIALPLGLTMTAMDLSPAKLQWYAWHKWLGVTLFGLAVLRVVWRLTHPAPPWPAGMPDWQRRLAGTLHGLLYVLLLAIPLSGWLMSSAKGFQTVYLGLLPLPDLVARNASLGESLSAVHALLNDALMGLIGGHVLAALKHHLFDHDDVMRRMLPGRGRRNGK